MKAFWNLFKVVVKYRVFIDAFFNSAEYVGLQFDEALKKYNGEK